jgi:CRISPR system Cascade subunit CasC
VDLRDLAANIGEQPEAARELVAAFLTAFIESLPQAKKNSTAPHTIPDLVHLSVRGDRPLSYAAAFEKPVSAAAEGGFVDGSIRQLDTYAQAANRLLGSGRILASGWAGLAAKDLEGLGARHESFAELIDTALDAALGAALGHEPAGTAV